MKWERGSFEVLGAGPYSEVPHERWTVRKRWVRLCVRSHSAGAYPTDECLRGVSLDFGDVQAAIQRSCHSGVSYGSQESISWGQGRKSGGHILRARVFGAGKRVKSAGYVVRLPDCHTASL